MRTQLFTISSLALLACSGADSDSDAHWLQPGCGNGVIEAGEACDDGELNSDVEPDACRTTCWLPVCGDGVVDSGESCDDANELGGDGCAPGCVAEDGAPEVEQNNSWDAAQAIEPGLVHGSLPEGDVDCFSFDVQTCESIEAVVSAATDASLALHGPDGTVIAVGAPTAERAAHLDPERAPGARFVQAGAYAVCVEPLLDPELLAYSLDLILVPADEGSYPSHPNDDGDGDGVPNDCDGDRDGDGVDNDDDNCPDVPNGPDMAPLAPSSSGFIRDWLAVGPFTGNASPQRCLPSLVELLDGDDGAATPSYGDTYSGVLTRIWHSAGERLDFLPDFGHVGPPREVYLVVYAKTDVARDLTLATGPDDGIRAWVNGAQVLDIDGCQGTNVDQFTAQVRLESGWNRLTVKVFDQGGGWGTYVRFIDSVDGPVTDLELSLDPNGPWAPGQIDSDDDGLGDVCDETPYGDA